MRWTSIKALSLSKKSARKVDTMKMMTTMTTTRTMRRMRIFILKTKKSLRRHHYFVLVATKKCSVEDPTKSFTKGSITRLAAKSPGTK